MERLADTSLAGKDLRGQDLRGFDFSDKVLFGTDLRGAQLYGAKFAVLCANWDGVKLDNDQVAWLLLLFSKADTAFSRSLRALARDVVGIQRFREIERLGDLL